MSDLSFLVRGRSVDLVAMTARRTLQSTLGLGDEIVDLTRDQLVCISGIPDDSGAAWTEAIAAHQHWFNPNKHRFASFLSADGAFAAIAGKGSGPRPGCARSSTPTDRTSRRRERRGRSRIYWGAGWRRRLRPGPLP